jgi:ABC-type dipeptide/oligopeptide/nickel transport system permease subunit
MGDATDTANETPRGLLHPAVVWSRLRRNPPAVFGLCLAVSFVLMAVFAPLLAPHSPTQLDASRMNEPPSWLPTGGQPSTPAQAEGRRFFGRDVAGRDILSRVIYGARTSLLVGVGVVSIAGLIGVLLGSLAGYCGGKVDALISRAVDILLAFPFLILAIAVVSILPRTTMVHIAVVLGLTSWPGISRLVRGQVLATRELDFVSAARALGSSHARVLVLHILPNCIAPVIIWFAMGIAGAVMAEASLSFLGFGQEDSLSWGAMISIGLKAYLPDEWWAVAFPAGALALLVLAFNLLGDGLQDALNPKQRR